MNTRLLATTTLTSMFFISGFDKLIHFEKAVYGLGTRLSAQFPKLLLRVMIVCALAIEIVSPLLIFRASLKPNYSNDALAAHATLSLIIFTVLATLIYHFPPFTSAKYYPFISNLSAIGGLLLMWGMFRRNL